MEVGFDSASRQVDEESRRQHLTCRHGVPGDGGARAEHREQHRQDRDDAAQEDRRQDVQMDLTEGS